MRLYAALIGLLLCSLDASAQPPNAQRGRTYAETHCARCHSIDKVSDSPLRIAPPLRILHKRYPIESLQEALAEGIVTGHSSMPQFILLPYEISDLIAFLKTLEDGP